VSIDKKFEIKRVSFFIYLLGNLQKKSFNLTNKFNTYSKLFSFSVNINLKKSVNISNSKKIINY